VKSKHHISDSSQQPETNKNQIKKGVKAPFVYSHKKQKKMENTIEVKNRNFRLELEHHIGFSGYATIHFGEDRPEMIFSFDYDFDFRSFDGRGCFERVDARLSHFEWLDCRNGFRTINKRNIKLLCEVIEKVIGEDPESWGMDWEEYEEELCWEKEEEPSIYSSYPSRISADKF
jgi:hypothetical protein